MRKSFFTEAQIMGGRAVPELCCEQARPARQTDRAGLLLQFAWTAASTGIVAMTVLRFRQATFRPYGQHAATSPRAD